MSTQAARAEVADALLSLGITNEPDKYDDGIHSWRCTHPDVYGRCTCFDEAVDEITAIDWRVLGGLVPGFIPVEWVRVGDRIIDHGVEGVVSHIKPQHANLRDILHVFLDSGHVSFAKVTRQEWVHVIEATNHPDGSAS
uniref:hypothetical protein n=1 Tax=Microbacterium proteolyticum TaxID=1572644 RepID=UPI002415A807|nr:hypothetical protein [Microbacterium proteolyticum]